MRVRVIVNRGSGSVRALRIRAPEAPAAATPRPSVAPPGSGTHDAPAGERIGRRGDSARGAPAYQKPPFFLHSVGGARERYLTAERLYQKP